MDPNTPLGLRKSKDRDWRIEGKFVCDAAGQIFEMGGKGKIEPSTLRGMKSAQMRGGGIYDWPKHRVRMDAGNFYFKSFTGRRSVRLPSTDLEFQLSDIYVLPGPLVSLPVQDRTDRTPRYVRMGVMGGKLSI